MESKKWGQKDVNANPTLITADAQKKKGEAGCIYDFFSHE